MLPRCAYCTLLMRFNDLHHVLDRSVPTYAWPQHSSKIAMSKVLSPLCVAPPTRQNVRRRICCRAGTVHVGTLPYRMDMLLCCVSQRDDTQTSCRLPRYRVPITASGGYPRYRSS